MDDEEVDDEEADNEEIDDDELSRSSNDEASYVDKDINIGDVTVLIE